MHDTIISATDLARQLGDVLGRIRYRGESFIVERNGTPVARIGPVAGSAPVTVREALSAWLAAAPADDGFAADLQRIGSADTAPTDPWDS